MTIILFFDYPFPSSIDIKNALRPGGQVILETIGIPGTEPVALFPEDRYAKMRNVWFVPTCPLTRRGERDQALGTSKGDPRGGVRGVETAVGARRSSMGRGASRCDTRRPSRPAPSHRKRRVPMRTPW